MLLWLAGQLVLAQSPLFQTAPPPEIWAMRNDPALVEQGAIVLEDTWRVGHQLGRIERTLRVRVLAQPGRRAVEFDKFYGEVVALEGRVSYPDGTSLALQRAGDLVEKVQASFRGREVKRSILIPPGITADCLFEVHVTLKGSLLSNFISEYQLGNAFPTRTLVLDLGRVPGESLLLALAKGVKVESVQRDDGLSVVIRDLPALDALPFQTGLTANRNRLFVYGLQMGVAMQAAGTPESFWAAIVDQVWKKAYLTDVEPKAIPRLLHGQIVTVFPGWKGPAYTALAKEVLHALPVGPQARATELYGRLARRVKRISHLSDEEELRREAAGLPPWSETDDFETAVKNGETTSLGWHFLYFHLLEDAGVHPVLLKVLPAWTWRFIGNLRSTFQFDWTLLKIEEPGKPALLIDADLRFGQPGSVSGQFQGTTALAVDSSTWKVSACEVDWQAPETSVSTYAYTLQPQGPQLGFELRASFEGVADGAERTEYLGADPHGRKVRLSRKLEAAARTLDTCLDETAVSPPEDPQIPFTLEARGRVRMPRGERLLIDPAPCLPPLVSLDQTLPEGREEPYYFGPPRSRRVSSRIRIPEGYRWPEQEGFDRANELGRVSWEAKRSEAGTEVVVTSSATLRVGVLPASRTGACRDYLAWLKEASERQVLLERAP